MLLCMKAESSTPPAPESRGIQRRLQALRDSLLNLHKALVDSERVEYERTMGKIQSPNHFLELLVNDPWFAWLRPLPQLIVSMDQALGEKAPLTDAIVKALEKQTNDMLVASETGTDFAAHYFEVLQRDPDVVLAHAEVVKLRRREKPGA
jgi:hypothetical protein